jgi:hypothetical protein
LDDILTVNNHNLHANCQFLDLDISIFQDKFNTCVFLR